MTGADALDRLQLRRATADDAPRLDEIVAAAARAMAEQGFKNWLSPDATGGFAEDIATREVYLVVAAEPGDGARSRTRFRFRLGLNLRTGVRPQFQLSKGGQTPTAPDGTAIATFTLGSAARRPYSPEPWLDPGAPALYLTRLAVDPALQGGGIGGWCLDQIERLARERGARAIRCDVLTANTRLCRLYDRFGYVARGDRPHSGWSFTCYERIID